MAMKDTVKIAPIVLVTIASQAALQVDGVARMGSIPVDVVRLFSGSTAASGVVLAIGENQEVSADIYLIVKPNVNMRQVGLDAQAAIVRSIHDLVDMNVKEVNIHIDDVDYSAG